MTRRKKIIAAVSFFIVLLLIGAFIGLRETPKELSRQPLRPPSIPRQFKEELPVKSSLEEKEFDLPSRAPLLEVSPVLIFKEEASEIAIKLDFIGEPLTIKDFREGTKFIWSNETFFLVVTPSTSTIKYGLNNLITTVPNKKLSDDDLANI